MIEVSSAEALDSSLLGPRREGRSVGLVPTMGYLHGGHRSLLERARAENEVVVVSIYVNPTQFGPSEDLDRYPRDLDRDRLITNAAGADILFVPTDNVMYPVGVAGQTVWVDPGILSTRLCGAFRPGHFRGVATVVAKLFLMVRPSRAYFGQKDALQLIVIRRMVRDLGFPVEVRAVPTVREPDGLALSSRNVYLSASERHEAAVLARALETAGDAFNRGERDARELVDITRSLIEGEAPSGRVEYVKIVDVAAAADIEGRLTAPALLAVAVVFGRTRLIDNLLLSDPD